ncbi:hypothetical protein AMELA_G00108190 [Ameiurus melas]|uniref:Alpha-tectorin n=1 Tax=Ameiurus melas TaxID=219545 RepID=A0A7J6AP13_AMEME|nr:hypothetical protein AMELA_G00108190 [Ameiurus melas]
MQCLYTYLVILCSQTIAVSFCKHKTSELQPDSLLFMGCPLLLCLAVLLFMSLEAAGQTTYMPPILTAEEAAEQTTYIEPIEPTTTVTPTMTTSAEEAAEQTTYNEPIEPTITVTPTTTTSVTPTTTTTPASPFFDVGPGAIPLYLGDGAYKTIHLDQLFIYDGKAYTQLYLNVDGYLAFFVPNINDELPNSQLGQDIISPLWTDLDFNVGEKKYEQATCGPLIDKANQEINRMFPNVDFSASWVFVATWENVPLEFSYTEITSFQVVLASDSGLHSFILMNYGTIPYISPGYWLAGYGMENSNFVTIPVNNANELSSSSNVNIPGRWAFQFTASPLFDVGPGAIPLYLGDGAYETIQLDQPFVYNGKAYTQLYLNMDGYLAFFVPNINDELPNSQLGQDIISPLWTDLDFYVGEKKYEQATSGPLIDKANQEINRMFPNVDFSASWVFVATWKNVPIEFSYSEAGYGMENSNFVTIPVNNANELSSYSNVNFPGRWAFQFIDAIETCSGSSGSLSLSRCELFEAGFSADNLHLKDSNCKGELQNNRLVFSFDSNVKTCGTTRENNDTHIIFSNNVGTTEGLAVISRAGGLNINFSCVYPLIQSISMPTAIEGIGGVISRYLSTEGSYQITMIPYTDATFQVPLFGNVTLEVNHQMYIAVQVDQFDRTQIGLLLDSCWATPVNQIDYSIHWDLISNECPNPKDGTVAVLQNGVSTTSYFSFRMFTFTSFSTKIYLHCQVHLCLLETGNCAQSCPADLSRRRRDVDFYDSAAITMEF